MASLPVVWCVRQSGIIHFQRLLLAAFVDEV